MTRRIMAMLLALCMAMLPCMGALAEELELFISTGELVLDKDGQTDEESALDGVNKENASILEQLGKKDWTSLAASVQKKGDWREDIVAVAQTQVGYTEEADGMTIYTTWAEYEKPQEWTALFVNWVTTQAGLTEEDFPHLDTYKAFTERMNKLHALKNISRASYPMSGDLALIEKDDQKLIGIVVYVSNGVASVIIGDDNGAVTTDTYYVGQYGFKQYIDLDVLMERAGIEVGKGGEVPVIPEGGVAAWTNTNAVYMRSEPTTASKRVTTVKKTGTALLVVSAEMQDDGYIWYGVEYGKYTGYIRGDLLDLDRAALPTATPVPTATPAPTATPEPTATPAPTEVPGCVRCAYEADGVALPVECCYEHLASMGAEESYRFMSSLLENDYLTFMLYVNCHAAHVGAGEAAVICHDCEQSIYAPAAPGAEHSEGCGWYVVADPELDLQERVVNVEVKDAAAGQEVKLTFEIYGAMAYEWHEICKVENADGTVTETDVIIEGATEQEIILTAKTDAVYSYYCVATILANGEPLQIASKTTQLNVGSANIEAEAILGEEINFTYTYEENGASIVSYQWYIQDPETGAVTLLNDEEVYTGAKAEKLTFYATLENSGKYFYCVAVDANDAEHWSSYYVYRIEVSETVAVTSCVDNDLCRYIEELAVMTREERYSAMTQTWNVEWAGGNLADYVSSHWYNHIGDYPNLLCNCGMKSPDEVHASSCPWYVEPETDESGNEVIVQRPDQEEYDKWSATATAEMIARAQKAETLDHVVLEAREDGGYDLYVVRYANPVGEVDANGYIIYGTPACVIGWLDIETGTIYNLDEVPDTVPSYN